MASNTALLKPRSSKARTASIVVPGVGACITLYFFVSSLFSSASITSYSTHASVKALFASTQFGHVFVVGTVFHAFLGEKLPGWKSAASLVRKIAENYKLPYYTMSPTDSAGVASRL
mgnify:CR=1 FL=1